VLIVAVLWCNSNVPVKSMQVKKYRRQCEKMYVNKSTLNELRKNRSKPTRRQTVRKLTVLAK